MHDDNCIAKNGKDIISEFLIELEYFLNLENNLMFFINLNREDQSSLNKVLLYLKDFVKTLRDLEKCGKIEFQIAEKIRFKAFLLMIPSWNFIKDFGEDRTPLHKYTCSLLDNMFSAHMQYERYTPKESQEIGQSDLNQPGEAENDVDTDIISI